MLYVNLFGISILYFYHKSSTNLCRGKNMHWNTFEYLLEENLRDVIPVKNTTTGVMNLEIHKMFLFYDLMEIL